MGSRYNILFADEFNTEVDGQNAYKRALKKVFKEANREYGERSDEEGAYSGNISAQPLSWPGEEYLVFAEEEFEVSATQEEILRQGNPDVDFPYETDWFLPIFKVVEQHAKKWGPSVAIRINGHWTIQGFYAD